MKSSMIVLALLCGVAFAARDWVEAVEADVKAGLYACAEEYYAENAEYIDTDEDPTDEELYAAEAAFEECVYDIYQAYGEEAQDHAKQCVKDALATLDDSEEEEEAAKAEAADEKSEAEAAEEAEDEQTEDEEKEQKEEDREANEEEAEDTAEAAYDAAAAYVYQCIEEYYESTQTTETAELFIQRNFRVFSN